MKYKLKNTDEMYVKVYPYSSWWVKAQFSDMENIKRNIERHVDDIGDIELYQEQLYTYSENDVDFEACNLIDLCSDIAREREILEDACRWTIKWTRNGKTYSREIWTLEDLLDYVSRYNCDIVSGNLGHRQKILVDIARDLYSE